MNLEQLCEESDEAGRQYHSADSYATNLRKARKDLELLKSFRDLLFSSEETTAELMRKVHKSLMKLYKRTGLRTRPSIASKTGKVIVVENFDIHENIFTLEHSITRAEEIANEKANSKASVQRRPQCELHSAERAGVQVRQEN